MRKYFIAIVLVAISLVGCSNTYNNLNESYNKKNKKENRSLVLDTVIATTLYNYPELQLGLGKSFKKTKTKTVSDSTSTTLSESKTNSKEDIFNSFSDDIFRSTGESNTNAHTHTEIKTKSKTKSKSVSGGISIKPNLDFFTK